MSLNNMINYKFEYIYECKKSIWFQLKRYPPDPRKLIRSNINEWEGVDEFRVNIDQIYHFHTNPLTMCCEIYQCLKSDMDMTNRRELKFYFKDKKMKLEIQLITRGSTSENDFRRYTLESTTLDSIKLLTLICKSLRNLGKFKQLPFIQYFLLRWDKMRLIFISHLKQDGMFQILPFEIIKQIMNLINKIYVPLLIIK